MARRAALIASLLLISLPAALEAQSDARLPGLRDGVRNLRELSGFENEAGKSLRPGVLLRSGSLAGATEEALVKLKEFGIRRVVDLRTMDEIRENGADPRPFGRKPMLLHMAMDVEVWTDNRVELFQKLWRENAHVFGAVLEMLADPDNHPVLVHGQYGIERTGIVTAMVLELAGAPRKAILEDFVINDGSRKPYRGNLERVMDIWDAHEKGLEGWLMEHAGLGEMTLLALKHTLHDASPFVEPKEEGLAQKDLDKVLKSAAKAKYAAAAKGYVKLADKYPKTRAGRIAARRARPSAFLGWAPLVDNGPSVNRVDVVLMGDGYTLKTMPSFDKLAEDIPDAFQRHRTYGEYYNYFNFLRASLVSKEDGVDAFGREYDTALNAHDSGAAQGQVAVDRRLVMKMLEEMPEHDRLAAVFVKKGVLGTGGSGVATIGGNSIRTLIHEWGHAFADLGDEYTSNTGHRSPRNSINVASSPDPEKAPWRHWIDAGVPGVGMHEGANGMAKGAWKPTVTGCTMGSSGTDYCRVCREHVVLAVHRFVDPIESCTPKSHPLSEDDPFADPMPPLLGRGPHKFEVKVMQPQEHTLEVRWWVLIEAQVPPGPTPIGPFAFGDRRDRGPLATIEEEPEAITKGDRKGVHKFTLKAKDYRPGRYRVICRARDLTNLPDEEWPWVLKDEYGLLVSERAWWVEIKE